MGLLQRLTFRDKKHFIRFIFLDVGMMVLLIYVALLFQNCTCIYPSITYPEYLANNRTFSINTTYDLLINGSIYPNGTTLIK